MATAELPLFTGALSAPAELVEAYQQVRGTTELICAPLETGDYMVQAMPNASPAKWHLGHVTWFFETFILKSHLSGYRAPNPAYEYLFNSYYNGAGPQFSRHERGLLSRPTVAQTYEFRSHVDNLSVNPLRPTYEGKRSPRGEGVHPLHWVDFRGGMQSIGHDAVGFAFDNEWPRHQTFIAPYRLASRLVTNGEYVEFIEEGGYEDPDLWLSDGWRTAKELEWRAPLYWEKVGGEWHAFTLSVMQSVDENGPVSHVSYYEADAYAR